MAEPGATPAQGDTPSSFNLQIVSPSASVSRPLVFASIPASTTIRQLKEKIRNAVATRPADDQQRLIHRGRLLARDEETLENILGAEAIRSGEQQTLHLVLRDLSDHHHAPAHATALRGQSPAPGALPETQQRTMNQQPPRPPQPPPQMYPHPHQHIHAGHAFPLGNRPLTAPIIHMPPVMLPLPFQPNGPFHPPVAGVDAPTHEQLVNQAQQMMAHMMNQNQQRAGTPVGGTRASSNPPPTGQDPTQIFAQLAQQLAQNAQQQENLANQAEQITILLANPATNQPSRAAASQQFVNQGNVLLNRGHRLMGDAQQLVDRSQRERAAAGLHGIQDHGHTNVPGQARNLSGRNSPAIGHPVNVTREMVGPNGQVIRMTTTVNGQAMTTQNGQPLPILPGRGPLLPNDVQNLLRGAEASQATQAMTNAMHRSASGASLANMANANAPIQPIAPGVTTSVFQNASRHGSRTATPDPSQRTPSHGSTSLAASAQPPAQRQGSQSQPEVYIMSSPNGPHALLLTNQGTYFTPPATRQPTSHTMHHQPSGSAAPQAQNPAQGQNPAQAQYAPQGQQGRPLPQVRWRHQVQALPPRPAVPPLPNGQVNPAINLHQHPRPPNAGAAAVLAAVWPHIWLLVRLAAFVWWFTASDSSWSRWITVVLIAIGVFAVNTGLFNGIAHQAWDPFRRHLEGLLLPGANPPHNAGARQGDGAAADTHRQNPAGATPPPAGQQQPRHENPDPAEAAARLVAQRQHNNANRVMDQIRRIERAGLLFLASIAPGVAERHIAHLEAQERTAAQERARREAEAAEAAAAAQGPAAEGTEDGGGGQVQGDVQPGGREPVQEPADGPVNGPREGPLIEV
ncbi:hypothetical protein BR93DRAFT_506839 [Coniochaeta sp. PMI_546]|nr:hypothetical protein BR93DRAFT_506839 [Coniochaeta sp. PMI_546]